MFNKFRIIIVVLLLSGLSAIAQNKEVPFTQDDRDRLIRLDVKYEMLEKRFDDMNKRFDDMNKRIDDIKTFLYWGFGILFGMMMFLFGFILWDRRTALAPVIKENKAIKEVLVKLAETNPDLKKALKYAAIL
ncbi:MAG: hypothetical protein FVQ77_16390 [Cytophagales bacterium]|nr:hypothetical protein [Cytophagales bacterium]